MDDLISRQAAKQKVARVIWEYGDDRWDFHKKCVDCLDDVPSAQPELVRCKDCKFYRLDDAEKRYLKGVIRPFRNQIISICKEQFGFNHESIIIEYYDFDRSHSTLCLPQFEKGSMYAGMKQGKHYTLEELGI